MSPVDQRGRICVVGGSLAGTTAASTIRRLGYRGLITLVTNEEVPPYNRPSLSKGLLSGPDAPDSVYLPEPVGIEAIRGKSAQRLDLAAQRLILDDDTGIGFDGLVIATGARAKTLASDYDAVYTLRSICDAIRLRRAMRKAKTLVMIGGGPLAMEIASAASGLGIAVTVVTNAIPLRRQLGTHLAKLLLRSAETAGVNVVIDPSGFFVAHSASGRTIVRSATGHSLTGDIICAAIGCVPNVDWLLGSGLEVSDTGLIVDEFLCATDNIVAAGDVAAVRSSTGAVVRTPMWLNAMDQAAVAATNLLTDDVQPFRARPFFWTELFGHRIKVAGTVRDDAELAIERRSRGTLFRWLSLRGDVEAAAVFDVAMPIAQLRGLVTSYNHT